MSLRHDIVMTIKEDDEDVPDYSEQSEDESEVKS